MLQMLDFGLKVKGFMKECKGFHEGYVADQTPADFPMPQSTAVC
jgi:hypothetical protein